VVTGGGAKVEGLVEFIRDLFKVSVRIGHVGTGGFPITLPEELSSPEFSACFGCINWYKIIGGLETSEATMEPDKKHRKRISRKTENTKPKTLNKFVEFLKKLV